MPRHLVTVWNPAYAVDAMDAHVEVLADRARRHRAGDLTPEEEVHVWWGKVRSSRREAERLPHHDDIVALDQQLEAGAPTYLYLTDYTSLYVADLAHITDADIQAEGEGAVPAYYAKQKLDVEIWFQIWDIRRLVADDTKGVIEELGKLRNVRYHDRPVSLYGGMVELPLIVETEGGPDWFGSRAALTEGRLWAERDAEYRHEIARLGRDLRDNLFGEHVWSRLEPATRTFLASAEAVIRARREDPTFDFSGPAVEYAKAFETEVNAALRGLLRRGTEGLPPHECRIRVDGREVDLRRMPHLTLGALRRILLEEPVVKRALQVSASAHVGYFTDEFKLPKQLEQLQKLRNPAAHDSRIAREEVLELRGRLMGIGVMGELAELVRRTG
jgi:hypothetical protein